MGASARQLSPSFPLPPRETVLAGSIFVLALAVRLWVLGREPLHPQEARLALAALDWLRHGTPQHASLPLYPWWTGLLFFLGHADAFWARLASALWGTLLTLMPWLFFPKARLRFRFLLGLALALDPALVLASRIAHGPMWALVPALLLLWAVEQQRYFVAAVALLLTLSAGWMGWWSLFLLGLATLVQMRWSRTPTAFQGTSLRALVRQVLTEQRWAWAALLWAGWLGFGHYGSGLSALGQGLADLLPALHESLPRSLAPWFFLAYQAPLLLLALLGFRNRPLELQTQPWLNRGLAFGLTAGILWLLSGFSHPFWSLWVNVALWPAGVAGLLHLSPSRDVRAWALTLFHLSLGGFVLLMLPELLRAVPQWHAAGLAFLRLGMMFLALWLLVLSVLVARSTLPATAVQQHVYLALTLMLLALQMAGWHRVLGPARERLWLTETTAPGLRQLRSTWQQLALWRTGRPEALPATILLDTPFWRWHLRDMSVHWAPALPRQPQVYPEVLLTPAGQDFPMRAVVDYRGSAFTVLWQVRPFEHGWQAALWWLHQESVPVRPVQIVLWVRADVFP